MDETGQYSEQHRAGTLEELAHYLFNPNTNPGEVVIRDEAAENNYAQVFYNLCTLYVMGVNIYNNRDPNDHADSLQECSSNTTGFMRERMLRCLHVEPLLTFVQTEPEAGPRFHFHLRTADDSVFLDRVLGTELRMRMGAHGVAPP